MVGFSKCCWVILCALALAGCKSGDSAPANPGATTATPAVAAASPTAAAVSASPSSSASSSAAAAATVDPCSLLTSDELKAAQGEDLKQASRSDQQDPDYVITQCYYLMPTAVNSVVINLTEQKSGGKTAKDLWERMFESGERGEEDEGEKAAKPEKIAGLGGEAIWIGSRVGGALYVLKKDMIFRISIGGAADMKTKLARSKTLAAKALARIK
jgi:hypothetical protein